MDDTHTTDGSLLRGKVLLVAGVGPGMGAATAMIGAREGAKVALLARTSSALASVAQAIRSAGGEALELQCDVAKDEHVREAVAATINKFGKVDTVFYNAAFVDHNQTDLDIDENTWDKAMSINLGGAISVARYVVPSMLETGKGAFVFNSTVASLLGEESRLGYGIFKSGLNSLIRFVASRYGPEGIRSNGIFPFVAAGDAGAVGSALNCLGRSGTAEEIGEVVAFLLSDRSALITGQLIHLDGGMFARAPFPRVPLPGYTNPGTPEAEAEA